MQTESAELEEGRVQYVAVGSGVDGGNEGAEVVRGGGVEILCSVVKNVCQHFSIEPSVGASSIEEMCWLRIVDLLQCSP